MKAMNALRHHAFDRSASPANDTLESVRLRFLGRSVSPLRRAIQSEPFHVNELAKFGPSSYGLGLHIRSTASLQIVPIRFQESFFADALVL